MGRGHGGQIPSQKSPPSSVGLVWGLKSTLRERLPSLLGIAEKRENSFIQAVNEMSFAIHFHGRHVADPQHPRVAPAHTGGGVTSERVLGRGENAPNHRNTTTPSPELGGCVCHGCYGRLRWLSLPSRLRGQGGGVSRDLAEQHTFSVGSGPRNIPGFYFSPPLITCLYPSHCTWVAGGVPLPFPSLQGSAMRFGPPFPSSPHYLPPLPSSAPSQFLSDPLQP